MAKKTICENFRVEVYPHISTWYGANGEERSPFSNGRRACKEMINMIKRRCGDSGEIENIDWTVDEREVCEYCEGDWEVWKDDIDYKDGVPVCCDKAVEEWEEENRTKAERMED